MPNGWLGYTVCDRAAIGVNQGFTDCDQVWLNRLIGPLIEQRDLARLGSVQEGDGG